MCALAPLLRADTRWPWCQDLYCSDASGGDSGGFGGFGVCKTTVGTNRAAELGRVSERWRYGAEELLQARRVALGILPQDTADQLATAVGPVSHSLMATTEEAARRSCAFSFVPRDQIGEFKSWTTVISGRW